MTLIEFPALLSGPIIRQVDQSHAYIWIATSKNYLINVQCFNIEFKYEGNQYIEIRTRTKKQTVSLGKNLYVHLLEITPSKKFPPNQLIGYNLHFKNKDESFDLEDHDLLNPMNPNNIIYGSLKYPSFYISIDESPSTARFLFGSCRKPHGEGEDTLVNGDKLIEETCRELSKRPEALFLMGDQIYADDVADPLFRPIHLLGHALMGVEEMLSTIDPQLLEKQFEDSLYKINGRKQIIQQIAKFTSGNCDNHLIEFGEYAAMYLLAWSPTLWELSDRFKLNETFDEAFDNGHIQIQSKSDAHDLVEKVKLKIRFTEQEKLIAEYRESTYKIRRLMANIPTYMIFDDHDITDDWNITEEWKENVQKSPLGRHVVANGLAAFWAFQGWGNQPRSFKSTFVSLMEKYFRDLTKKKKNSYYKSWVKLLWEHSQWYFVTPTNLKAIFLDTRTQRKYTKYPITNESEQLDVQIYPPQLVNEKQLRGISKQLRMSKWKRGNPLLLVSATPVIGFELIEAIVAKFSIPLKMVGVSVETVFDMEAWRFNGMGLTKILAQLAKLEPSECMILSGDVHYSFIVDSTIHFAKGQQLKIKQITSSPIKNMSFHKLGPLVKFGSAMNQTLQEDERVYRYCDLSYIVHNVAKDQLPTSEFIWKEELNYETVDDYSIIETENNLGYLSIAFNAKSTKLLKAESK
ncbi:PhoD-like phosphatase OS=Ureibacillus acetophenoni OX=614649 GN=SAMN05877842_106166 PE=4 SV=1 [Ureibacillus acetophenoni]